MSKTSKRAITILIIATFMMSIFAVIPVKAAVIAINVNDPTDGTVYQFDDVIVVKGTGVTSGAQVNLYWDYVTPEGLLNNTLGEPDGTFEVWLDVPEAIVGDHYLWVKDVGNDLVDSRRVVVDPLVEVSPSSGLPGDDIDVEGHGFGDETVVGIQIDPWDVTPIASEAVGTGDGTTTVFYLDTFPVDAGSEAIEVNAVLQVDPADYTLVDATGQITFVVAPAATLLITADYYRAAFILESSSSFETDELGAFTKTFDVPSFPYGPYTITALDDDAPANTASDIFTLGASITITPDEGNTGTVVTVDGRGWTPTETISFTLDATETVYVVDAAVITVGSTGKFSADVVIPSMSSEGEYDLEATESGAVKGPADDSFEVLGLPEISVSPTYGSPGATITVTGSNFTQKADTEVVIELWGKAPNPVLKVADLVIAETDSDGTFEDTFMSPAVGFVGYDVRAYDLDYDLYAEDPFKVGLIAMIINPTHGAAGTEVALTGIGFKGPGNYNLTFGDILYEDHGTGVSGGEAISDIFYVPNVEPGTYDVTVVDEDENELSTMFTVTHVTVVTLDPAMAPNDYNMTIEGENFADKVGAVEFLLYNSTDDWAMDVYEDRLGTVAAATDIDGNFTGWWEVLPEADISIGDYTINVTGPEDFLVQVNFSLVEARVDVAPRKALFDRGDTIQFNVKNDFDFPLSYMEVWDPYDNLYWKTELFADWVKAAGLYTVPYYLQTSGKNPMTLTQDAPMGTWFYIFYEEGTDQLVNGTFEVGPSSAAQVDEKLSEIWGSLDDLTSNIDDITDEIAGDIDALSSDINDVVADVQDMVDDITADLAGELAQVADDAREAVEGLEDNIGDIADAQNELASELDAVSADTTAAKEAAEDAKTAATGLTTLVYGAIGASLIAALAAIVSLMQISKKIA